MTNNGQVTHQESNGNLEQGGGHRTGELQIPPNQFGVGTILGGTGSVQWGQQRRHLGSEPDSLDWKLPPPKIGTQFHFY